MKIQHLGEAIKEEARKGRWQGISPENFHIYKDKGPNRISINLWYRVPNIIDWFFLLSVMWENKNFDVKFDLYVPKSIRSPLLLPLPAGIVNKLNNLWWDFVNNLQFPDVYKSITMMVDGIEIVLSRKNLFEKYCLILDEISKNINSFKFEIPITPAEIPDDLMTFVKEIEKEIGLPIEVVTNSMEINHLLKYRFFTSKDYKIE